MYDDDVSYRMTDQGSVGGGRRLPRGRQLCGGRGKPGYPHAHGRGGETRKSWGGSRIAQLLDDGFLVVVQIGTGMSRPTCHQDGGVCCGGDVGDDASHDCWGVVGLGLGFRCIAAL